MRPILSRNVSVRPQPGTSSPADACRSSRGTTPPVAIAEARAAHDAAAERDPDAGGA
ncbi:hypothetical protein AB0K02_13795 [Streptomyces sp. NPDC049597]|uniref:hypothetical protein n=1 Tax=Streptomyces sp. NPDC049597 TaxID=3155276 RepID=UPI003449E195